MWVVAQLSAAQGELCYMQFFSYSFVRCSTAFLPIYIIISVQICKVFELCIFMFNTQNKGFNFASLLHINCESVQAIHPVPWLSIRGALPQFPHNLSCRSQCLRYFYWILTNTRSICDKIRHRIQS